MVALQRSRLDEFHSHAKLGVHDSNHTAGLRLEISGLQGESDAGSGWEGRVGFEIAATQAEVAETAGDGRIVLLGLGQLVVQPVTERDVLLLVHVLESDPAFVAAAIPGELAFEFQLRSQSGEFQRETE